MKNKNFVGKGVVLQKTVSWILLLSCWATPFHDVQAAKAISAEKSSTSPAVAGEEEDPSESNDPNALIARGYLIRLTCVEDAKLNGEFRVGMNGKVQLPYDVSVTAAGLKRSAFEAQLEKIYKPYFRGTPQIKAAIKQKRYWVKISGVVKSPGNYLLREHSTLDEALAMADVRTENLPTGFVRINQGSSSRWVSLEDYLKGGPSHDLPGWRGGEQITFQLEQPEGFADAGDRGEKSSLEALGPSARKVQVLGEVKNPGGVSFQKNADGYYYLIQRGGPTQNSDLEEVALIRRDQKTGDAKQIQLGNIGDIKNVQESDVLLINTSKPSKMERRLQTTALITSILSSIVLSIYVTQK